MKIRKVENSSIKTAFESNVEFFMGLLIGFLIGASLISLF